MKKRIVLALVTLVLLLAVVLSGCSSGIPQEQYDQVLAQFNEAQAKINEARANVNKMEADMNKLLAELKDARSQIDTLRGQVGGLKEQATLTGATPAETAEKIVKNYHETHIYDLYDMFICSDMSSEVWNMLKAQNIKARVVVGNKDAAITDILQSNHAWVLADVGSGATLALETTAGLVMTKAKNPLYYRGWYFDSPAALKRHNEIVREHNIRIGLRNQLAAEVNKAMELNNNSTNQVESEKWTTLYTKLVELKVAQENEINKLKNELSQIAKPL